MGVGSQVGEAFHPSKTCTTVLWTFHQFYDKALLEYERHKIQTREIDFPFATVFPEANGHQTPGPGSGWARRDAAARAMQGWHAQRLLGFGGEEKKFQQSTKARKKSPKHWVITKTKRPSEVEHSVKALRTETSRQLRLSFSFIFMLPCSFNYFFFSLISALAFLYLFKCSRVVTTVADIGAPANWVKISV